MKTLKELIGTMMGIILINSAAGLPETAGAILYGMSTYLFI
jgi:hypothetical protein